MEFPVSCSDKDFRVRLASISIVSTALISALVLGTIITASYTLIRKRKEGVYSSLLILYFSIGLFIVVNSYMVYIFLDIHPDIYWLNAPDLIMIGFILFVIGSILMVVGYTVKIKSLLKILSLFVARGLIAFGAIRLGRFFMTIIYIAVILGTPLNPEAFLFLFPELIIPICALAIVAINYILYRRTKKKSK